MQAIKIDRVVVARRMQRHAVRRRPRLFVADIGVRKIERRQSRVGRSYIVYGIVVRRFYLSIWAGAYFVHV